MIRTLKITSIITAGAAVILLILPMVFGVHSDPAVAEILKEPGVVERFKESKGQVRTNNEGQISPLVKQAMEFTRYLNPPPPPTPPPLPSTTDIQEAEPMSAITAKFDLRGTSYYPGHPELSLALIDEPGKGLNWVRQGSKVGHIVIEEVKDGVIIVIEGQKKSEMKVDIKEAWRELLKNPAGGSKTGPKTSGVSTIQPAKAGPSTTPSPRAPIRASSGRRVVRPSPESAAAPATAPPAVKTNPQTSQPALSGEISQAQEQISVQNNPAGAQTAGQEQADGAGLPPPPIPTEKDIIHTRLMEEVRQSRMTEEEAKAIEESIQTLEQLDEIQRQRSQDK